MMGLSNVYGTWSTLEIAWTLVTLLTAAIAGVALHEHQKNVDAIKRTGINGAVRITSRIVSIIIWTFIGEQVTLFWLGVLAGLSPQPAQVIPSPVSPLIGIGLLATAVLKCLAAGVVVGIYKHAVLHEMHTFRGEHHVD
jgi:hypothetical protein